ncbi:UvrD/REP helicase [Chthoniobacter flavus Ellin428]|uniref:DNA 3'-5' helicase n=1 Tax=Chthoniobacter flavus Ellin428 TaxID=497964 RepID=B4D4R3_9BACT|nr:UvrD-helicase domain-containing protein [Chthoniobacter flavus]EDY18516.1 UvrD/REP helicase [Chthoniobacter flavus Ellin428]TCO91024.1 DNA helicase-2/ATP-dependent DNA helicase PcrA [Chthoniobacter flavus]
MARQYTLSRPSSPAGSRIDFAAELNPQQHEAVTAPPGPALVIAGAGSGKTRTLTFRVAYLLENGVLPQNILLLTFTNKAAREMLDRVANLLPNDISGLWGGTFHSVGNRLLRRHPEAAGFAPGFSIMDREDQQDMLDSVIVSAGIDPKDKRFPKGEVLADVFSFAINTGRSIDDVLVEKYPHFLEFNDKIALAQKKYEEKKRAANSLDFDDLLEKTLLMLQKEPAIAERYQRQFQFVLVDEYQDTNRIQADFIDILAKLQRNVMVVGDDAQSIYSWRGANFKNILDFPKRYPGAKVYKIETNYRSAPDILDVANAAIAGNVHQFKKELVAARPAASMKPALVPLGDSNQQALFVAQRILDLREEGIELDEIAVLYRAHFHSMEVQMELTRHGIPFSITSGLRFFEQAHIKDVAAFLKFVVNPRDEVAFKRMVRLLPGIGARSAEQLWNSVSDALSRGGEVNFHQLFSPLKVPAKAARMWEQLAHTLDEIAPGGKPHPPAEMIRSVIEAVYDDYLKAKFPNYEQRREDLTTLGNFSKQYESAADFLDQLALLTSLDSEVTATNEDAEMLTLSSVHQAKGLEWKVVFVIWMADGMFPSNRSLESDEAIEEERRLFYVAVTRAKDELYLTYPNLRLNAGYGEMLQRPSRFLGEVPKELLEEWQVGGASW